VLPAGLAVPGYRLGLPGIEVYQFPDRRSAVLAVSDLVESAILCLNEQPVASV
jgi:hypothetical protein